MRLAFTNCHLGTPGLLALGLAFTGPQCNQTLQELNLENNGFTAKGLFQFVEMLHNNVSITECKTEEKKAMAIIKGLIGQSEKEGEEADTGREDAKQWKKAQECLREVILIPNRQNYIVHFLLFFFIFILQ
jgi:hypothetical protein